MIKGRGRKCFVNSPLDGVENKDYPTIYHIPLIEWKLIYVVRNESALRNSEGLQHRLLPETATPFDCRDGIDNAESQDAFDWTGDQT